MQIDTDVPEADVAEIDDTVVADITPDAADEDEEEDDEDETETDAD